MFSASSMAYLEKVLLFIDGEINSSCVHVHKYWLPY